MPASIGLIVTEGVGEGVEVGVGVGVKVETNIGVGIGVSVGVGLCPNASSETRNAVKVNPAAREFFRVTKWGVGYWMRPGPGADSTNRDYLLAPPANERQSFDWQ